MMIADNTLLVTSVQILFVFFEMKISAIMQKKYYIQQFVKRCYNVVITIGYIDQVCVCVCVSGWSRKVIFHLKCLAMYPPTNVTERLT